jgi:UBX domain-containing protein 1
MHPLSSHFYLCTMFNFCFTIFSGMVVRDRSKRKNKADEVFNQAKKKGAKQGPFEPRQRSSRSFSGTARLLAGESVQPDAPQPPEDIVHNICFWSNGFTVNDGPLRSFDDPENASFLEVNNTVLHDSCIL